MKMENEITEEEIERAYNKLKEDTESGGYNLNGDTSFTRELVRGLLINEKRYGYQACPCRLASGVKEKDLDIICPCYYRDPDLEQYGTCYCALYVDDDIKKGVKKLKSIPDRRFIAGQAPKSTGTGIKKIKAGYPVWRCRVCGYLCARDNPPQTCPVCKVKKERFELFLSNK